MKLIGRKLYLSWGDNMVVAIEKLSINPEELGLKKLSDLPSNEMKSGDYIQLRDVIDYFGEIKDVNPRPPLSPSPCGSEFEQFFLMDGNWIDENDAESLNQQVKL